jgi:regulator of protease activity HflC (stomatin/prohibitin superfamily)
MRKKKMMKVFGAVGLAFVSVIIFLMIYSPNYVEPGHVGVKVYQLGDDKGVGPQEVGVGRYWLTWNERLYVFPTFTQNYTWTQEGREGDESFTFNDKDGTSLNADVGISYAIDPEKVPLIFQKYRRGVDEITDIYLRNMVRDGITSEASVLPVEAIYGVGKEKLLDAVLSRVKAKVEPLGIKVEELYWIGKIRLPEVIEKALNDKIKANQDAMQAQNQVLQRKYEADKKIEDARGAAESVLVAAKRQAEANDLLTKSLTPELLAYKKLENEIKAIDKWGGVLPTFMGGSTPVPFIDVTNEANDKP